MNVLLDVNVILDNFDEGRRERFVSSVMVFEFLKKQDNVFISSSAVDNIAFLKIKDLRVEKGFTAQEAKKIVKYIIKDLVSNFKVAKTPSYIDIDYDDIEDSQIIASAKAIDARVITRDVEMLVKYPDIAITPTDFLQTHNQKPIANIDFANLRKQYFMYQPESEEAMDKVLNTASYIMGDAVKELEYNLETFTGANHAVTCSSGTDALLLAMMALGIKPGDEVITTPFTFIATAETIALLGAKPVFVDIDEATYNIDVSQIVEKITPQTKAIMPVSLYGQPSDLDEINKIVATILKTKNQKLYTIVDGAQSFGATYKGKAEVHHCDIYTTSFFPAKPLGCFGDGGAVLTNDKTLATKMRQLRVHGQDKRYHHKYIGLGARMDTLQCAVTNVKLKYYAKDLALRQEVARMYNETFASLFRASNKEANQQPILPKVKPDRTSAYAQYSIRVKNRDEIQQKLKTNNQQPATRNQKPETNIPTAVHYPMPLHLQEAFAYLGYKKGDFPIAEKISHEILSLPMNPYLTEDEIEYIVSKVIECLG